MRRFALPVLALGLAGCTGEANHLGTPLLLPWYALTGTLQNGVHDRRRGEVELFVKSNHPALLEEIAAGGGPLLGEAMDLAGVPEPDRPTRLRQLQADLALHAGSPEALIVALMVYGG